MKTRLYIIGNGFDMHHGIKTSYHGFASYLIEKDYELYNLLKTYFHYSETQSDLWSCFEENLANFNVRQLLEDNRVFLPDIEPDEFKEKEMYVFPDLMETMLERLTSGLIDMFSSFIRNLETPRSAHEKMVYLDKDALFFSFN